MEVSERRRCGRPASLLVLGNFPGSCVVVAFRMPGAAVVAWPCTTRWLWCSVQSGFPADKTFRRIGILRET